MSNIVQYGGMSADAMAQTDKQADAISGSVFEKIEVGENVYRFLPFRVGGEALRLAHGVNERIEVRNLVNAVRFYRMLLRDA